jgi:hypothetical protein
VEAMLQVAYNNNLITKKQKDSVVGWEIMKGDNSIHKSVISNGVALDVLNYTKEGETIHFPNFPFNNLGEHKFIKDPTTKKLVQHPYNGESNNKFTYFSPDMFLTRTQIPSEMSLQGYMFGSAVIRSEEVEEHPKWTLLGDDVYRTAGNLAGAELLLEIALHTAEAIKEGSAGIGSTNFGWIAAVGAIVGIYGAQGFVKYGEYRYQWLETFRNLGRMDNFAHFQYGIGKLNRFKSIESDNENYLRNLSIKKYLRDGDFKLLDETDGKEVTINNHLREASVFLSTGPHSIEYPQEYISFDNNKVDGSKSSNVTASDAKNQQLSRNIANPYISLKNYVPDQWDTIDSIKWLTTNYIFDISQDTKDSVIYGGYQVISRFSWRTKTPYFTSNAVKSPDKIPYLYSKTSNIGDAVFYCDYETAENAVFKRLFTVFPDIKSSYNLDEETGRRDFYLRPPSKFYLFSHGIIDFLVESEINCNFRYSKRDPKDQFYNNQTVSKWLQEVNVPIVYPNTFYYNNTYTFPVSNTGYKKLDRSYDKEIWKKRALKNNAWVWSEKDTNENSIIDPWLVFRPLNFEEDKTNRGKLIDLRSIESDQFLGRYEDQLQLFNQANNVADAINNQTKNLGTGYLYSRPISFKKSDLGFAGTQNTDFVSTPYGHFWADAKRGRVFNVDQNGGNLEVISESIQGQPSGMKQWFREHLPFKILKYFPDVDVDNKYKGLGINMWYDDRNSRVFITKKDYIPIKTECLNYSDEKGFYTNCGEEQIICPDGYTYNESTELCEISFQSENLCPPGYTYNLLEKTCTLTETVLPECTCTADVFANSEVICSTTTTDIDLTSTQPGVSFSWTVSQTGVSGATAGSGSKIAQLLTSTGSTSGVATYTITPFETISGCMGTPITVSATVKPTPNVIATPSSLSITEGESANINLTSNLIGTTFSWTVSQSGTTGATPGSGNFISQILLGVGTTTYTITPTNNGCSGVPINVVVTVTSSAISCGGSLSASGSAGYYEVPAIIGTATGEVTVTLNAFTIPDRFQIIWDGNIVADSLFIGDILPNPGMQDVIINTTTLNKFLYNSGSFDANGTINVDYSLSDISNSTGIAGTLRDSGSVGNQIGVVPNYPSPSAKASDGDVKLKFNKTTTLPIDITIVAIGVEQTTAWNLISLECP